ncbi:uncharacterized protein LOC128857544 [Anastrepha ludens]|uniref:uncharacterized protein LOC128857544 n=1 Tax=Anastrepha ludens TaxID=28586 RepID=UPI0023B04033|nr:uncharacterized protein LOC128857544 [Anastrepha ludens]
MCEKLDINSKKEPQKKTRLEAICPQNDRRPLGKTGDGRENFLRVFEKIAKIARPTATQPLIGALLRYWRKMQKPFLVVVVVLLIVLTQVIISAPVRKSMRIQLNADYLRAMGAYKRLESRFPREELQVITTIGILNGAQHAEQQMERNLVAIVKELLFGANELSDDELVAKVENIEKQLVRDHRALLILTSAMDLVTGAKDVYDFKSDMQQTLQQIRRHSEGEKEESDSSQATEVPDKISEASTAAERLAALRRLITQKVRAMKMLVEEKVTHTLDYLIAEANEGSLLEQASKKVVRKRNVEEVREVPAEVRMIKSILTEARLFQSQEDFRNNLVDTQLEMRNNELFDDSLEDNFEAQSKDNKFKIVIANRSDSSRPQKQSTDPTVITTTATTTTTLRAARATKTSSARAAVTKSTPIVSPSSTTIFINSTIEVDGLKLDKQQESSSPLAPLEEDEDFPDAPPPPDGAGGGGLVGIISSLSGGEGGSDIGALIGALTGVISTLFGPGGLDIESLISTATSLISGLLAGNKNFGTVLGIYIGTAFDGLSGGGGAVNNGQFLGNLLGTVYAQLSADPEDDDLRPNPLLFARNLISSFMEAKNRKESDEEGDDERRSDSPQKHGDKHKGDAGGGSDSGGFIKHIASHIVGSLVSLLLNASLGASGGASHASASLFGSSSHKSGGGGGAGGGGGHKY